MEKMIDHAKNNTGFFLAIWGWIVSQGQWLAAHFPDLNELVLLVTLIAGVLNAVLSGLKIIKIRRGKKIE